jgi:succinate dehydrogenase / fumarate reductase iron-sulfur subunit
MSDKKLMTINLKVWRQKNAAEAGRLVEYAVERVSPDQSFLEMLDVLYEQLIA